MPFDAPNPSITRAGFTGQEHDLDLGLVDMKGRIYDPLAARFTSADPIMQAPFFSQGLNRYSYVFNDPINHTDPSGFAGEGPDAGGYIAAGYVGAGYAASAGIIAYGFGGNPFGMPAGAAALGLNELGLGVPLAGQGSPGGTSTVAMSAQAVPTTTGTSAASPNAASQNRGAVGPPTTTRRRAWKGPDLRIAQNDAGVPESIPDAGVPAGVPEPDPSVVPTPSTGPGTPYVGDPSRKPPGWTPDWREGVDQRGPYSENPVTGEKWYPHHDDPGHWDHYENDQGGNFPKKNTKPWPNQKRAPYGRQSATDPWVTFAGGGMMLIIMIVLIPLGA